LSGQIISLPLQDKLFWQYLKDDIVPALHGWFKMFGQWNTACVRVLNGDLGIAFDNRMRNERVLDKIPPGSKLYCVLWFGCGSHNWRVEWIGNACDTPLIPVESHCPICLDALMPVAAAGGEYSEPKQPWMLECGHTFHKSCIGSHLDQHTESCPLCKKPRTITDKRWAKI